MNVTAGKLKVRLIPNDNFDPGRSYTTFGLGETGTIQVETIPQGLPLNVTQIGSSDNTVCVASNNSFTIKRKPGSATITVKAKINNSTTEDTETYGVTGILPTGVRQVKINNQTLPNNTVGSAFFAQSYLSPTNVSFSNLVLREGEDIAVATGSQVSFHNATHPSTQTPFTPTGGNIIDGCQWGQDNIAARNRPLNVGVGSFAWNKIPLEYQNDAGNFISTGMSGAHLALFNGQGGCTISKFGNSATRVPQNQTGFNQSPTTYQGGFVYTP